MTSSNINRTDDVRSDQLRDWYLARLRKRAFKEPSDDLTPAALIDADRKFIANMIKSSVNAPVAPPSASYSKLITICLLGWISVVTVVLTLLICVTSDFSKTTQLIYQLTVGVLLLQGPEAAFWQSPGWMALLPLVVFAGPLVISATLILVAFKNEKPQ